jgi:hypothetical protein
MFNESKITNAIEVLEYGEKFNEFLDEFNISVSNFVNEFSFSEVIDIIQTKIILKNICIYFFLD